MGQFWSDAEPESRWGYAGDRVRLPFLVKKSILVWFPIEWASTETLSQLPPNSRSQVFSYLPCNNHPTLFILPIEAGQDEWIPDHRLFSKDQGVFTVPRRHREPKPGEIESVYLALRYEHSIEDLIENGTLRSRKQAGDYAALSDGQRQLLRSVRPGFAEAYRTCEEALLGQVELRKPVSIRWQASKDRIEEPWFTQHLKDDSYLRIYPVPYESFWKILAIRRVMKWPAAKFVRPFCVPPRPGDRTRVFIRWVMAHDGRPTGQACLPLGT